MLMIAADKYGKDFVRINSAKLDAKRLNKGCNKLLIRSLHELQNNFAFKPATRAKGLKEVFRKKYNSWKLKKADEKDFVEKTAEKLGFLTTLAGNASRKKELPKWLRNILEDEVDQDMKEESESCGEEDETGAAADNEDAPEGSAKLKEKGIKWQCEWDLETKCPIRFPIDDKDAKEFAIGPTANEFDEKEDSAPLFAQFPDGANMEVTGMTIGMYRKVTAKRGGSEVENLFEIKCKRTHHLLQVRVRMSRQHTLSLYEQGK